MADRGPYRIDDVLIKAGIGLGVLVALAAALLLRLGEVRLVLAAIPLGLAPIGLLAAGMATAALAVLRRMPAHRGVGRNSDRSGWCPLQPRRRR